MLAKRASFMWLLLALLAVPVTSTRSLDVPPSEEGTPPLWKPVRGIHLTVHSRSAFERLTAEVPALAALGVNLLIAEVNYSYEYASHPELNAPGDVSKAQVGQLVKQCREQDVRLIPQFQCVGHQSWKKRTGRLLKKYPQFDETPGQFPENEGIYCRSWCPLHPEVNGIVFDLFDELIEGFHADALHVGMDEIFLFASEHCKRCKGKDPGKLFADVIKTYHDHLVTRRGVEMLMWGDRLLSMSETGYSKWNADDKGMDKAIGLIPKDTIICDWNYQQRKKYKSLDIFQSRGFRVLSCGWNKVEATEAFVDYSLKTRTEKYLGHVCTVWGACKPGALAGWPPIRRAMEKLTKVTEADGSGE